MSKTYIMLTVIKRPHICLLKYLNRCVRVHGIKVVTRLLLPIKRVKRTKNAIGLDWTLLFKYDYHY